MIKWLNQHCRTLTTWTQDMFTQYQSIALFAVLTTLVFLGDDKQSITLVIACAGTLGLYLYDWFSHKATYHIEKNILLCWVSLFISLVLSSFSSLSLGYSITEFVKYTLAFLLFVFFSNKAHKNTLNGFIHILFIWAVGVSAISLLFTVFPYLRGFVPNMNLLYKSYGHNHIVNVIFFGIPASLFLLKEKKSLWNILGLLLLLVVFSLSFSRGGILLLCAYGLYMIAYHTKNIQKKTRWLLGAIALIIAIPLFVIFSRGLLLEKGKPSILDSRIQYWKQAALAIKERPLLGWGPGTFYLVSKRFQERKNSYSWYAHSLPLQVSAELGVVGLITLCLLLYVSLRRAPPSVATHGVILALIYSSIEMNLDFIVIWILLWVIIGLQKQAEYEKKTIEMKGGILISLVFIGLYYGGFVLGGVAQVITRDFRVSFYSQPYIVDKVIAAISLDKEVHAAGPTEYKLSNFFHKHDPGVISILASQYAKIDYQSARLLYNESIKMDPFNDEYYIALTKLSVNTGNYSDAIEQLKKNEERVLSKDFTLRLNEIDLYSKTLFPQYVEILLRTSHMPKEPYEYAKIYYQLGLEILTKYPEATRLLWAAARDISPTWGYYHAELASLEKNTFSNHEGSTSILVKCQSHAAPRKQCEALTVSGVNEIGFYKDNILAIPSLLQPVETIK